jgi:periplasmic protein TonB
MRWFMLPVSIGAHVIAAVVLLIVPLAAEVDWPPPAPLRAALVTPVAAVPASVVALAPPRGHAAAPRVAPPFSEAPERDVLSGEGDDPVVNGPVEASIDPGLPSGIGSTVVVTVPPPAEQQTAVRSGPLRIGQGVRAPKKIVDASPVYPAIALSARVQGAVILEAVINERGDVERVRVLRSEPLLDRAAIDAVRRWRYTPTTLNGTPVAVLMTITINFTLR